MVKEGWFNSGECRVDFDTKVPKLISLKLRSGSGNLLVSGTKGKIDYELGSGDQC